MSRTTKDAPDWVKRNKKSNWVREDHTCTERGDACDLAVTLTATDNNRHCEHTLAANSEWERYWRGPRADEVHDEYWMPERASVRDGLIHLAKEHHAGGEPEAPSNLLRQSRSGTYAGGWWS